MAKGGYDYLEADEEDVKVTGDKKYNIETTVHAELNRILKMCAHSDGTRIALRIIERTLMSFDMALMTYWSKGNTLKRLRGEKIKNETEYEEVRDAIMKRRGEIGIDNKEDYLNNLYEHLALIMFLIDKLNLGLKRVISDET